MSDLEILARAFQSWLRVVLNVCGVFVVLFIFGLVNMEWDHYQACQADKRDHISYEANC